MLDEIQAWFNSLPGAATIQHHHNGTVFMALQSGTVTVAVTRKTFAEAAEACIQQMGSKARRSKER